LTVQTAGFTLAANVRTLIVGASVGVQHVTIHNHEHNQNHDIFVGGPDVTITNGMHAVATETNTVQLLPSDELYAISATNGVNIRVLVVK
jgi:hypothetical protein